MKEVICHIVETGALIALGMDKGNIVWKSAAEAAVYK